MKITKVLEHLLSKPNNIRAKKSLLENSVEDFFTNMELKGKESFYLTVVQRSSELNADESTTLSTSWRASALLEEELKMNTSGVE